MNVAQQGGGGNGTITLLLFGALIVGMYFLLIRPQQKRRREMLEQQQNISIGDEIVTIGGLYGTVVALDDETMTLQISDGVTARYARQAFAKVATKGELPGDSTNGETGTGESTT